MERNNCHRILLVMIFGAYVIIFGCCDVIFGAYLVTFSVYFISYWCILPYIRRLLPNIRGLLPCIRCLYSVFNLFHLFSSSVAPTTGKHLIIFCPTNIKIIIFVVVFKTKTTGRRLESQLTKTSISINLINC